MVHVLKWTVPLSYYHRHIILCTTLHHTTPHTTTSHCTTLHHTTLHHTTPHYTTPYCTTPHHTTPSHHTPPHLPWIELSNVGIHYCTNAAIVGRIETLPTSWNCPCMYDHWRVSNSIVLLLCVCVRCLAQRHAPLFSPCATLSYITVSLPLHLSPHHNTLNHSFSQPVKVRTPHCTTSAAS